MTFNKKTWQNRVSEQPQRRLLTPTDGGTPMTVDVTRQEGLVIQDGDAFSAENMNDLETRIKNTFDSDEATLNSVNNKANTNASNISTLQSNLTSVSNRVTTNTNSINGLSTRMTAVENKATGNTNSINGLSTRMTAVENKATGNTNSINSLNGRMGTAEGNITSLSTRAGNLETRATNLESRAGTLENELTANGNRIYMDFKNGKYGYNTSASRGADTFHPFKGDMSIYLPTSLQADYWTGEDSGWGVATISLVAPSDGSLTFTNVNITYGGSWEEHSELNLIGANLLINGTSAISFQGEYDATNYPINQSASFTEGQTLTFQVVIFVKTHPANQPQAHLNWTWNLS